MKLKEKLRQFKTAFRNFFHKDKINHNYLVITIMSTLITVFVLVKDSFFKSEVPTNNINQEIQDHTIQNNSKNQNVQTIYNVNSKISKAVHFSFRGFNNLKLQKRLKQLEEVSIVNSLIEITFTGNIDFFNQESNVYHYTGGEIQILINQNNCYTFKNFKIPQMRPSSREEILKEIQHIINGHIDNNIDVFYNKISECIKNQ